MLVYGMRMRMMMKHAISKSKSVDSAKSLDDDTMSADTPLSRATTVGTPLCSRQSSTDDGSEDQLDEDEAASVACESWSTISFWDDRDVDEVLNTLVAPLCSTLSTVPIIANVPPPSTDMHGDADASPLLQYTAELRRMAAQQLLQHAAELRSTAAQLEAEAGELKNRVFNFPKVHPVAQDTMAFSVLQASDTRTTVMIRNIPNNSTRADLLDRLASQGFQFSFDFVYLPMDFKREANLGYAFVNFLTHEVADRFYHSFNGFRNWGPTSTKIVEVTWGKIHGLDAHIERYRNSPVMHENVPDEHKPVLVHEGQRVPFPAPTKRILAPRKR
jgi:hypothetical protein